jgi:hypothetical protein
MAFYCRVNVVLAELSEMKNFAHAKYSQESHNLWARWMFLKSRCQEEIVARHASGQVSVRSNAQAWPQRLIHTDCSTLAGPHYMKGSSLAASALGLRVACRSRVT